MPWSMPLEAVEERLGLAERQYFDRWVMPHRPGRRVEGGTWSGAWIEGPMPINESTSRLLRLTEEAEVSLGPWVEDFPGLIGDEITGPAKPMRQLSRLLFLLGRPPRKSYPVPVGCQPLPWPGQTPRFGQGLRRY